MSNRQHNTAATQTPNPEGRVDVLLCRILERVVETHPAAGMLHKAVYYSFKNDIAGLAQQYLGPRTNAGRTVRKLVAGSKQAGVLGVSGQ